MKKHPAKRPGSVKCGYSRHSEAVLSSPDDLEIILKRTDQKHVPKRVIQYCFPNVHRSRVPSFLCTACINYVAFLKSITMTRRSKGGEQTAHEHLRLAHAYESLLGCRRERFVGEFAFSNAVVKNTYNRSSTVKDVDNACTPSGSSTAHRKMLAANAQVRSAVHQT